MKLIKEEEDFIRIELYEEYLCIHSTMKNIDAKETSKKNYYSCDASDSIDYKIKIKEN